MLYIMSNLLNAKRDHAVNVLIFSTYRYLRKAVDLDILSQARNNKEVKVSLMLDPKLRLLKDKLSTVNLVGIKKILEIVFMVSTFSRQA